MVDIAVGAFVGELVGVPLGLSVGALVGHDINSPQLMPGLLQLKPFTQPLSPNSQVTPDKSIVKSSDEANALRSTAEISPRT